MKEPIYYIAYGSNLNLEQMAYRCPGAKIVGKATLKDWRLVFRGACGNTHATVERAEGHSVPILVWKITLQHEATLDRYEGTPRYYTKEYLALKINDKVHLALIYIMADGNELGMPSERYYRAIEAGYTEAGFDTNILEVALSQSTKEARI